MHIANAQMKSVPAGECRGPSRPDTLASRADPGSPGVQVSHHRVMDGVYYEDLRGRLFSLLILLEDRLGGEQAQQVHHFIDVDTPTTLPPTSPGRGSSARPPPAALINEYERAA
jgi:hypothetical protein